VSGVEEPIGFLQALPLLLLMHVRVLLGVSRVFNRLNVVRLVIVLGLDGQARWQRKWQWCRLCLRRPARAGSRHNQAAAAAVRRCGSESECVRRPTAGSLMGAVVTLIRQQQ